MATDLPWQVAKPAKKIKRKQGEKTEGKKTVNWLEKLASLAVIH